MAHKKINLFFIIAIALIVSIAIFFGSCKNRLSLSQDSSDHSLNETESLFKETFNNLI